MPLTLITSAGSPSSTFCSRCVQKLAVYAELESARIRRSRSPPDRQVSVAEVAATRGFSGMAEELNNQLGTRLNFRAPRQLSETSFKRVSLRS